MLLKIMRCQFALLLAALMFSAGPATAHDIPVDAMVQMFVKPQGHTLHVLVRMPLTILSPTRNIPASPGDYVDLAKVDPSLRAAAKVALLENLRFYEGDRKLPDPRIVSTRMSLDSDQSFVSYEQALAHVTGPPAAGHRTCLLGTGQAGRAVRLSHPVGEFLFLDPRRLRPAGAA